MPVRCAELELCRLEAAPCARQSSAGVSKSQGLEPLDRPHAVRAHALVDLAPRSMQRRSRCPHRVRPPAWRRARASHRSSVWPRAARRRWRSADEPCTRRAAPARASGIRRRSAPRALRLRRDRQADHGAHTLLDGRAGGLARKITDVAKAGDPGLQHFGDAPESVARRSGREPRRVPPRRRRAQQHRWRQRGALIRPGINSALGALERRRAAHSARAAVRARQQSRECVRRAPPRCDPRGPRARAVMGTIQRASMRKSAGTAACRKYIG